MARVSFSSVQFPDLVVELDGEDYFVPGDIPIPDMIEIDRAMREAFGIDDDAEPTDQGEALLRLYDLLLGIFKIRRPDLERLPVGARGLVPLALAVLNPEQFQEVVPDPPPARRPAGTKTRSSTASRTRAKPRARSTS